jgi:hypothetical protein
MTTRYVGTPPYGVFVLYDDGRRRALPLRKDLYFHSKEFAWGYGGSGPAQLALALLADSLRDVRKAKRLHQEFKWRFVATLDGESGWEINRDEIRRIVAEIESENATESENVE